MEKPRGLLALGFKVYLKVFPSPLSLSRSISLSISLYHTLTSNLHLQSSPDLHTYGHNVRVSKEKLHGAIRLSNFVIHLGCKGIRRVFCECQETPHGMQASEDFACGITQTWMWRTHKEYTAYQEPLTFQQYIVICIKINGILRTSPSNRASDD